jgi:hypothetical protein
MGSARRLEAIQNQARHRFTCPPIAIASMSRKGARDATCDMGRDAVSRAPNRRSPMSSASGR